MRDFSKLNTLLNSANIFRNLAKAVMQSDNKKFLSKVSKILAEDNKVFNFNTSSFMLCQNLIKILYVLVVVYFLDREFHPKCLQW